eukprot:128323-Karenia_brevis.AAC.1
MPFYVFPPRGGCHGRSAVAHRFAAWAAGDCATVLTWWQHNRAAARHPRHLIAPRVDGRIAGRALELLSR